MLQSPEFWQFDLGGTLIYVLSAFPRVVGFDLTRGIYQ